MQNELLAKQLARLFIAQAKGSRTVEKTDQDLLIGSVVNKNFSSNSIVSKNLNKETYEHVEIK